MEHVGNNWTEQKTNVWTLREFTMLDTMFSAVLSAVIAMLFTLTAIATLLAIADSMLKARKAYARLMNEAALMQASFAVTAAMQKMPVQSAPVQRARVMAMPQRRTQGLPVQLRPAGLVPAYAA
ncbi:MAG: hypothetical protein NWP98_02210 [Erythrobacter sp.]|nr:hypothetical protein [Erythrobacter sp.]